MSTSTSREPEKMYSSTQVQCTLAPTLVQTTTDHSICQRYCSLDAKEFANSSQITKVIVTCLANLGNMMSKELSESKITVRFFTYSDGEIWFWRSGTGKFGASDSLIAF